MVLVIILVRVCINTMARLTILCKMLGAFLFWSYVNIIEHILGEEVMGTM